MCMTPAKYPCPRCKETLEIGTHGFGFCDEKGTTIFVFGSNTAGRHGMGAALEARRSHGAVYGVGSGRTGNSYAIPTKDGKLNILPLPLVARLVDQFKRYALLHPELTFHVTRVGCGLAGHTDWQIAPMFKGSPANCRFDKSWLPYLHEGTKTWKTQ